MDSKLTLKLDNKVIEKAKLYARKKNTSLSQLIEAYLEYITTSSKSESDEITPLVKSLSGIIPAAESNHKESYKKHIKQKYA